MNAIDIAATARHLAAVRARRPLVHNITNYVAMTLSANALLALGASPAMVHAGEEVEEFAGIADALVINIGTLSRPWIDAMVLAAATAGRLGKPWLLDPVAAGATRLRTETAERLLAARPTILRGNAGEVMALAGRAGLSRGVDSLAGSQDALAAAQALARQTGAVVAVTGVVDYATDGTRSFAVTGGHELMPRSTALGCALSAVTGAFAAVAPPLEAAVAALAAYGAAGAIAGARCPGGAGHLPAELCDALMALDETAIATHATITELAP